MQIFKPQRRSNRVIWGLWVALFCQFNCDRSSEKKSDPSQQNGKPDPPRTATVFIDPHGGGFQLNSDHRSDVHLRVANPFLGRTQLAIDGRLQGTLTRPSPIGQLNPKTLRLHLQGGLVPSRHFLQLVTTGVAGPAFSPEIVLDILPSPRRHPFVFVDPVPWLKCHSIDAVDSTANGIVFLGINDDPQLARVCRGSTADNCVDFRGPSLATSLIQPERFSLTLQEHANETVLRMAWLPGQPAETVMWQSFHWGELERETPQVLKGEILLDRSVLAKSEWSEFTDVAWIENNLLVGFHAPADTESPRPGDRGLLAIPWNRFYESSNTDPNPNPDTDPNVSALRPVNTDWIDDFDHLGAVVDPAYFEFSLHPGFIARFGRTLPVHLAPEELALVRVENLTPPSGPKTITSMYSFAMVRGAFGSRTIAAIDHLGRHQVIVGDQFQLNVRTISSLQQTAPSGPPSAQMAAGLVAGQPVFVVPFGMRRKVQAILSNGSVAQTADLDLFCDQVLTLPDVRNLDPDQLGILCLLNGEVKRGILDSHV